MRRIYLLAVGLVLGSTQAMSATAPPPPACTTPENHQFDFWIGHWDVYSKARPATLVAHSLIESRYSGCAIRENWMPLSPNSDGGSISTYVPAKKMWRQFWADSSNAAVDFEGGWNGKAMVLTGVWPQPGKPTQMTRMTYTKLAGGDVEQLGEISNDDGKSWQPGFDLLYRSSSAK